MTAAVADPTAREFLRHTDSTLRKLIDERPDFQPRAWLDALPPLDAFATLIFQVVGQQLSVRAARTIISRLHERFDGHLPSPQEVLAADQVPGVGPWTAHAFLIVALDRPDVLLPGDLALRHAVQHTYAVDQLPTEAEMVRIAQPWRPYRSLAVSYLLASEADNGG